jgi:hypothetical protein
VEENGLVSDKAGKDKSGSIKKMLNIPEYDEIL